MNDDIITACFQLITYVGTARSCFINAIQCAKEGKYDAAAELMKQGDEAFVLGHHGHSDLAEKETKGELEKVGLLLLHAEDQLMSAEGFRTIADEFIAVYKRLDGVSSSTPEAAKEPVAEVSEAPVAAPAAAEPAAQNEEAADAELAANSFK